ncbi:MAG: VOC family protein [Actinobacteria bacterium]|nr:VOC family protein [Actinomycetota bacterium]
MPDTFVNGQPCWLDIAVADTEQRDELIAFLGGLFGWTFEIGGPETGYYTMAMLDGQPVAALMAQPEGVGMWCTYFATDDIGASVARITDAGGDVFMAPMPVMDAGTMALATDPTGAVFGLWQENAFAGFGAFWSLNAPSWFDHQSPAPAEAAAFYAKVLEFDLTPAGPEGGGMLGRGERMHASISAAQGEMPPSWNIVIAVPSLSNAEQKARDLGGRIDMSRMVVPGGLASAIADPVVGSTLILFENPDLSIT